MSSTCHCFRLLWGVLGSESADMCISYRSLLNETDRPQQLQSAQTKTCQNGTQRLFHSWFNRRSMFMNANRFSSAMRALWVVKQALKVLFQNVGRAEFRVALSPATPPRTKWLLALKARRTWFRPRFHQRCLLFEKSAHDSLTELEGHSQQIHCMENFLKKSFLITQNWTKCIQQGELCQAKLTVANKHKIPIILAYKMLQLGARILLWRSHFPWNQKLYFSLGSSMMRGFSIYEGHFLSK